MKVPDVIQLLKHSEITSPLRSRIPFLLLIAAHIPFVSSYLVGLWQKDQYQFFPFAFGAFAWLFATRRRSLVEEWTWPSWTLVGADLFCLGIQPWVNSPWLAYAGLVASLIAWCYVNRDIQFNRRLTYLAVLPLIVLRLPLNLDAQVIDWLQRVTTSLASKSLHYLGMLHFREGNSLRFPGKSFFVAEACSGVQSLFTILFVAALIICLRCRSFVHGSVILVSGLAFAGLMNVLRVITITVAWEHFGADISVGVWHDVVGYVSLAITAAMLYNADVFFAFITDPVPDVQSSDTVAIFRNPFTRIWNRIVAVRALPGSGPEPTSRVLESSSAYVEKRRLPTLLETLTPRNAIRFLLNGCESWFFSRSYAQLLCGVPFIALFLAGLLIIGFLQNSSDQPLVDKYEAEYDTAASKQNVLRQETCLRALISLRPNERAYRFRIAQLMIREGRLGEGLNEIRSLTSLTEVGHGEARVWLVQQALQPNPLQALSLEEIEAQLKAVLKHSPNHLEAHELLGSLYIQRNELKLAEVHMSAVASAKPEANLQLARLMKALKRDKENTQSTIELAISALANQLEQDRANSRIRIALADAMVLAGQDSEAYELLLSGLRRNDDTELRRALTNLELLQVTRKLSENSLNRDVAVGITVNALQRDPSNIRGVDVLRHLLSMGAEIPSESLQASLNHWKQAVEEQPLDSEIRFRYSNLLIVAARYRLAAKALQPALGDHPELRAMYARLLIECGNIGEATALMESVVSESQANLEHNPDSASAVALMAEALLVLNRNSEARACLAAFADSDSRIPAKPVLAALYGRACINLYNELTGTGDIVGRGGFTTIRSTKCNEEADTLLQLLSDAFNCPATTTQAINKIAQLSLSSHPAARRAEKLIYSLRLDGLHGAKVLNLLGMHALAQDRFEQAETYLLQANTQARSQDAMVLNNLAIATIRRSVDNGQRALFFADQALDLVPDHPDALATRGEVYVAMSHWDDALADLTQALKLRGKDASLHRLLAKTYTGLSDKAMAASHRQRALELESVEAVR